MRTTQTDQRAGRTTRNVSRPKAAASQRDRRHHERQQAIARFEIWDRAMVRQHGWDYRRQMGWTLH
jgi:hypothetical protein